MAVPDGQQAAHRSLRPPFANAHRPRLQNMQPAVGKGLPSLPERKLTPLNYYILFTLRF